MTGAEFRSTRKRLRLTRQALGRILDTSTWTIARVEALPEVNGLWEGAISWVAHISDQIAKEKQNG